MQHSDRNVVGRNGERFKASEGWHHPARNGSDPGRFRATARLRRRARLVPGDTYWQRLTADWAKTLGLDCVAEGAQLLGEAGFVGDGAAVFSLAVCVEDN
jgi:hypothetical protein